MNRTLKQIMCHVLPGWSDGPLTVSLSAFGKEIEKELPDKPNPGDEGEEEEPNMKSLCTLYGF